MLVRDIMTRDVQFLAPLQSAWRLRDDNIGPLPTAEETLERVSKPGQ
jgi:hypothetical protein